MHTIALISLVVGRLKKLLNAVIKRFQKKERPRFFSIMKHTYTSEDCTKYMNFDLTSF